MNTEQKARKMYDGALDCAAQYDREGKAHLAARVREICTLVFDIDSGINEIFTKAG